VAPDPTPEALAASAAALARDGITASTEALVFLNTFRMGHLRPGTVARYDAALAPFVNWFAHRTGTEPSDSALSACTTTLIAFFFDTATKPSPPRISTLNTTWAALQMAWRARGIIRPDLEHGAVLDALRALRETERRTCPRIRGEDGRMLGQVPVLLVPQLLGALEAADVSCADSLDRITFRAQCALAWSVGLRAAEHVAGIMLWRHLTDNPAHGMQVLLVSPKNSDFCERVPLWRVHDSLDVPVLIRRLYQARGEPRGREPVFTYRRPDGSRGPEPRQRFTDRLRAAGMRAGIADASRWTGHSFRAGAASWMDGAGFRCEYIQRHLRWRSATAAAAYIAEPPAARARTLAGVMAYGIALDTPGAAGGPRLAFATARTPMGGSPARRSME